MSRRVNNATTHANRKWHSVTSRSIDFEPR
jgi:hypothetical protein